MTDNSVFGEIFAGVPLMAIMRGMGAERSLAVATRAWDLGITAVEVPVQTAEDVEALRVVADAARERGLMVGAGTVVTPSTCARPRRPAPPSPSAPGSTSTSSARRTRRGCPHFPASRPRPRCSTPSARDSPG